MLPFITTATPQTRTVEVQIGEHTASIELPIHHALLAGEGLHIQAYQYQAAYNEEVWALADALLSDGFSPDDAERVATRIIGIRTGIPISLSDAEHRAMLHNAGSVASASHRLQQEYAEQLIRKATAAIRYRVPNQASWSDDDTRAKIPQPLIHAIALFLDSEQSGGAPDRDPEEVVDEMVELLGKLEPIAGNPPSIPSTGTTSSGEPAASGLTIEPSPANDLPSPPSPTSLMPSGEAKTTG
jgi:hypothetical protein